MASGDLATYQAQLQQVEAALTNDPENEELLKLQKDLQEVVQLTVDLIKINKGGSEDGSDGTAALICKWKIGEQCQAVWSRDGVYYNAIVESIADDGQTCTVAFDGWSTTELVQVSSLRARPNESGQPSAAAEDDADGEDEERPEASALQGIKKKKTRADFLKEREYKRKRALKKQQRLKDMEEAREREKNKWQSFQKKSYKEKGGGLNSKKHKSIFASPDSLTGKVGVGTCGIGGQEMTKYTTPDKYQHRW